MAQIIIDVDDLDRVNEAFAVTYNTSNDKALKPNEFTKSKIIEFIKNVTANHEGKVAQKEAVMSAVKNVEDTLSIS